MRGLSSAARDLGRGGLPLFVLSLVVGCGFSSENVTLGPNNACFGAADCAQGVCEAGSCVDSSAARVAVLVEVVRGLSGTQTPIPKSWVYEVEAFSGAGPRNFTLPKTREVVGTVRWKGSPIPATLRFSRRASEALSSPLSPLPVEVGTFREPVAAAGSEDSDYAAVLVAGEIYDIVVLPNNDIIADADEAMPALRALPPLHTTIEVDDSEVAEPVRLDVNFPATLELNCESNQLAGCTLTGSVVGFDGIALAPASGLQVRAVEKESRRVVSSIGQTDGAGNYSIRLSPDAEPYLIRLTSPSASGEPFPSISVDPAVAFADDPTNRQVVVPFVNTVAIDGLVQDRAGLPVGSAAIRFDSIEIFENTALGFEGSFSASAETADDGRFSLRLLPGIYDAVVTPPNDAAGIWAPAATRVVILEGVSFRAEIVLPSQVKLSGSCATFTGEPASGVTVAARARTSLGGLQRSRETVSSSTGDYEMSVDSGLYDLVVKVSEATGFPWLLSPSVVMDSEEGPRTQSWELPPPIVVRGTVRDAGGGAVSEAPIRAYIVLGEDTPRAVQIGETITAADGSYRLLISPTLGDL